VKEARLKRILGAVGERAAKNAGRLKAWANEEAAPSSETSKSNAINHQIKAG
jgi:hypothetical protein